MVFGIFSYYELLSLLINGLGVLATFLAVVVALWQIVYVNRKRLTCKFNSCTIINSNNNDKKEYVCMDITNIENRKTIISQWRLKLKNKESLLFFTSGFYDGYFDVKTSVKMQ